MNYAGGHIALRQDRIDDQKWLLALLNSVNFEYSLENLENFCKENSIYYRDSQTKSYLRSGLETLYQSSLIDNVRRTRARQIVREIDKETNRNQQRSAECRAAQKRNRMARTYNNQHNSGHLVQNIQCSYYSGSDAAGSEGQEREGSLDKDRRCTKSQSRQSRQTRPQSINSTAQTADDIEDADTAAGPSKRRRQDQSHQSQHQQPAESAPSPPVARPNLKALVFEPPQSVTTNNGQVSESGEVPGDLESPLTAAIMLLSEAEADLETKRASCVQARGSGVSISMRLAAKAEFDAALQRMAEADAKVTAAMEAKEKKVVGGRLPGTSVPSSPLAMDAAPNVQLQSTPELVAPLASSTAPPPTTVSSGDPHLPSEIPTNDLDMVMEDAEEAGVPDVQPASKVQEQADTTPAGKPMVDEDSSDENDHDKERTPDPEAPPVSPSGLSKLAEAYMDDDDSDDEECLGGAGQPLTQHREADYVRDPYDKVKDVGTNLQMGEGNTLRRASSKSPPITIPVIAANLCSANTEEGLASVPEQPALEPKGSTNVATSEFDGTGKAAQHGPSPRRSDKPLNPYAPPYVPKAEVLAQLAAIPVSSAVGPVPHLQAPTFAKVQKKDGKMECNHTRREEEDQNDGDTAHGDARRKGIDQSQIETERLDTYRAGRTESEGERGLDDMRRKGKAENEGETGHENVRSEGTDQSEGQEEHDDARGEGVDEGEVETKRDGAKHEDENVSEGETERNSLRHKEEDQSRAGGEQDTTHCEGKDEIVSEMDIDVEHEIQRKEKNGKEHGPIEGKRQTDPDHVAECTVDEKPDDEAKGLAKRVLESEDEGKEGRDLGPMGGSKLGRESKSNETASGATARKHTHEEGNWGIHEAQGESGDAEMTIGEKVSEEDGDMTDDSESDDAPAKRLKLETASGGDFVITATEQPPKQQAEAADHTHFLMNEQSNAAEPESDEADGHLEGSLMDTKEHQLNAEEGVNVEPSLTHLVSGMPKKEAETVLEDGAAVEYSQMVAHDVGGEETALIVTRERSTKKQVAPANVVMNQDVSAACLGTYHRSSSLLFDPAGTLGIEQYPDDDDVLVPYSLTDDVEIESPVWPPKVPSSPLVALDENRDIGAQPTRNNGKRSPQQMAPSGKRGVGRYGGGRFKGEENMKNEAVAGEGSLMGPVGLAVLLPKTATDGEKPPPVRTSMDWSEITSGARKYDNSIFGLEEDDVR